MAILKTFDPRSGAFWRDGLAPKRLDMVDSFPPSYTGRHIDIFGDRHPEDDTSPFTAGSREAMY